MVHRLWPWLLLVCALCVALLVQPLQLGAAKPNVQHQFSLAIDQNPGSLDPALASSAADLAVTQNVFQTLLQVNAANEVVPDLAQTVTAHGHMLDMTLSHARTTAGQVVTADLVAESLARPLWKTVAAPAARPLLSSIVGYAQVASRARRYFSGVHVTGPETLTIQLVNGDISGFLRDLTSPVLAIVPIQDQIQGGVQWQFTNLVGSGGWQLDSWTPGSGLLFSRVDAKTPGPSEIDVVQYPTALQSWLSVVNGVLDAAPIQANQIGELKRRWKKYLRFYPTSGTVSLYYRFGDGQNSGYPKVSVSEWVQGALGDSVSVLSRAWPSSLDKNRPMALWVSTSNPMAEALAAQLAKMDRLVSVHQATPSTLDRLAASGQITAYIGDQSLFSHALTMPLAANGVFWMQSPVVQRASLFPDGGLNWSSVRLSGGN